MAAAAGTRSVMADDGRAAVRWNGRVDVSAMRFDYREYESGRQLDRESGGIPGIVFDLAGTTGRWALGGRFSWFTGDVLYDGLTTPPSVPIRTRTEENILDSSVRIERRLDSGANPGLTLYGGFGYRYWGRDIRPTSTSSGQPVDGLFEMYRWKYFFLGGKTALYRDARSRWVLDARALRPYRPTIEVEQSGLYDTIKLDLGVHTGWRVALSWEHRISARMQWVMEPYLEAWNIGSSPAAPLTRNGAQVDNKAVYEPSSTTRNLGLAVGLARSF
jgi:hypothetical protein